MKNTSLVRTKAIVYAIEMRAYGRNGRTTAVILLSNKFPSTDVNFSDNDNNISDNGIDENISTMADAKGEPSLLYNSKPNSDPVTEKNSITTIDTDTKEDTILLASEINQPDEHTANNSSIYVESIDTLNNEDISTPKRKRKQDLIRHPVETPKELDAFEFLNKSSKKTKRRKTNYRKQVIDDINPNSFDGEYGDDISSSHESMSRIIENVNNFLSTLQPENDNPLEDMFNEQKIVDKQEATENISSQKVYNNSRTLLINKNEDDQEQQMVDDYLDEAEEKKKTRSLTPHLKTKEEPQGSKTYHYNELKNMGKSLKYEEDFDYLTNDTTSDISINKLISKLLEFILTTKNDVKFYEYLQMYHSLDICQWCLVKYDSNIPELLLLQGYLMSLYPIKQDKFSEVLNLKDFIVTLYDQSSVPAVLRTSNKMLKHGYGDFLRTNDNKSGLYFALKLSQGSINQFSDDNIRHMLKSLLRFFDNMVTNVETFDYTDLIFQQIETILTRPNFHQIFDQDDNIMNIFTIFEKNNSFLRNETYLKCLILLTNDNTFLVKLEQKMKNRIVGLCFPWIISDLSNTDSESTVDVLLLELGLCLNLIADCTFEILEFDEIWNSTKKLINDLQCENDLIEGLFFLNFAYFMIIKKNGVTDNNILSEDEHEHITSKLKKFQTIASNFNETINAKIIYSVEHI